MRGCHPQNLLKTIDFIIMTDPMQFCVEPNKMLCSKRMLSAKTNTKTNKQTISFNKLL